MAQGGYSWNFDGVRLDEFPDLGDCTDDTRLIAELRGSGYHSMRALKNYLSAGRLGVPVAGAKGDGVADDTSAIQDAIDRAGQAGADVLLDAKRYRITKTLRIGDGSSAAVSSYGGVRLRGMGQPLMPTQFMGGYPPATARGTRFTWDGADGVPMLSVRGPLQGWGIEGVFFDGSRNTSEDFGGWAGRGVEVISAMNGDCRNLTFRGCREASIYSTTVPPPPGVLVSDSLHNRWDNINIGCGWAEGVKGIVLTGTSPAGSNTDYNAFRNVAIALPTDPVAAKSVYGVYLQSCDSNTFHNLHFFNGHPDCAALVFDYTVNPDWPAGNQFYGVDWGGLNGPIQMNGAPSLNARPNYVYAVNEGNGGFMPAGLKNVVADGNVAATLDLVGQTAGRARTRFHDFFRAGLYRLNYNLLVTGGGANGGNLAVSFYWLDGSGTPSFTSPTVPNGPGNFSSSSVLLRGARYGNIEYAVAATGIGGTVTTQYALMLALERLT